MDTVTLMLLAGGLLFYGPALAYLVVTAARRGWLRADSEVWFLKIVEKDGVSESRTVLFRSATDAKTREKVDA